MSEGHPSKDAVAKGSFWRSIKMVGWSFFGIRKNSASQDDMGRVSPFHVIAVGFAAVVIFVIGLIVLVNWVVAK